MVRRGAQNVPQSGRDQKCVQTLSTASVGGASGEGDDPVQRVVQKGILQVLVPRASAQWRVGPNGVIEVATEYGRRSQRGKPRVKCVSSGHREWAVLIYHQKIRNSRKRNFQCNGMLGSIVGQAAVFVHTFMDQKNLVWGLVMKRHWHIPRACTGCVGHVCSTLPETDFLQTDNHRLRGRDLLEQFPPSSPTQMGATHIESEESRMLRSQVHFNIIA